MATRREYLARGSMYRLLHHTTVQLEYRRKLKMGIDVSKGMAYLHSATPAIVHRDLKSPNLLVDENFTGAVLSKPSVHTLCARACVWWLLSCGLSTWPLPHLHEAEVASRLVLRQSKSAISDWRDSRRTLSCRPSTAVPARRTGWPLKVSCCRHSTIALLFLLSATARHVAGRNHELRQLCSGTI